MLQKYNNKFEQTIILSVDPKAIQKLLVKDIYNIKEIPLMCILP